MSRKNDRKVVYFATPVYQDDFGNNRIVGYDTLRAIEIMYVPATSDSDIAVYGDRINRIIKFSTSTKIDVNEDGGDGVYLEEPTIGEDGYYHDPEYITKPISHFGKVWSFDAEKV